MNKQEEIKQVLATASTEHEWDTDGTFIQWKDGHVLQGTYRQIAITEASNPEVFNNPNHENDAILIAKAPEYLRWLLKENEQLERQNQDLDIWATEGFEENQKLVLENVRLRNELDKSKRDKDVMSNYLNELMQNTSNMVVSSQIYNVLREAVGRDDYNPVNQKGENENE
ncbi:polyketide synthase docking domain-containing protein [Paenibacillus silvae]|uniref:Polyketide synthase NorB/C/GfsB-E-like docking domain-containing protein n=1 Tax=Paenibacillus silvae TaxID=1325358 RepID=A0A2W6P1Y5_9BACL|nr:polyketide synthase docking domain-containing protein [Paenibacillus silvae]PZT52206.1 hypothetical protein DN757_28610 [Paenibacillus silvae]